MGEMKPTPGPWEAQLFEGGGYAICADGQGTYGGTLVVCRRNGHSNRADEMHANARLIAEAGTVFHNTGLSPVQLVEMVRELRETLLNLYYYVSCNVESGLPKGVNISGKEFIEARAALAKCEGVGNDR